MSSKFIAIKHELYTYTHLGERCMGYTYYILSKHVASSGSHKAYFEVKRWQFGFLISLINNLQMALECSQIRSKGGRSINLYSDI